MAASGDGMQEHKRVERRKTCVGASTAVKQAREAHQPHCIESQARSPLGRADAIAALVVDPTIFPVGKGIRIPVAGRKDARISFEDVRCRVQGQREVMSAS